MEIITKPKKFQDPTVTADGSDRAYVDLKKLETLWFNTGTLCNLECVDCYIESSPTNDRLSFITYQDVLFYLNEVEREQMGTSQIGLTGGEPFLNTEIMPIIEECLSRAFRVLVLTNAMRLRGKTADKLLELNKRFPGLLSLRVSIDHYKKEMHEQERGPHSWDPALAGLSWLHKNRFDISIAGRMKWEENESQMRQGYKAMLKTYGVDSIDTENMEQVVLFPEMDEKAPVPEITTSCWGILNQNPDAMMCASSRMIVKHKEKDRPSVMACTLLAYDDQFDLGSTLAESRTRVHLNHPHCSKFCVLGGASCSA